MRRYREPIQALAVAAVAIDTYVDLMASDDSSTNRVKRIWQLTYAARLGSSVRSKGLFLEVRSKLPKTARKALSVNAGQLILEMPAQQASQFASAAAVVAKTLEGIELRPVIPREIEDILGISRTERHRWLKDGRLRSLGTRTAKLRGRATITFHVFDPRYVEDLLDGATVDAWRADDAEQAAENRRRAALKTKFKRTEKAARSETPASLEGEERFKLRGWADFERDGPI